MPALSRQHWRAEAALVGVTFIWGATFVLVKTALEEISTILFLALRFSIASVALGAVYRGRLSSWPRQSSAVFVGGSLAGSCLFAAYVFQTQGLRLTTPSKSAFLTGLAIVLVPLLGALLRRIPPSLPECLGVAVATVGMGLMTLESGSLEVNPGDMLTVVGAFLFALHILIVGHYSPRTGFEALSLTQIPVAAVLALGSFFWVEPVEVRWSATLLGALVVTGLLATAMAFTVQAWAQQHTTPTRTAVIFALEPIFAWATSYVVAGEVLSLKAALGAALILAGVLAVELKPSGAVPRPE